MNRAVLDSIRNAAPGILPSLLQCDFGNLQKEVEQLVSAGTKVLHLDVMDGHFVPNLTYGMPVVEGLRRHTDLPLDVHLMISDPLAYAQPMVDAGANLLTFHIEAVPNADDAAEIARQIRGMGIGVGVAINPETSMETLGDCLDDVDMVLVMSVQAGFGGQSFNPTALTRISELRQRYPDLLIEIDGGINLDTIGQARRAGCDLFVVGSAIFGQDDYAVAISSLSEAVSDSETTSGPATVDDSGEAS